MCTTSKTYIKYVRRTRILFFHRIGVDYSTHLTLMVTRVVNFTVHSVSNIDIAENCHRYLQVAFAEELYLYCQANNINFLELREALNTKWNVQILEPREGLPKDTKMFLQSSNSIRSKILAAAIEVDEDYKRYRSNLYSQPETKISV